MELPKIKSILKLCKIDGEIDSIIGNWVIMADGCLVNCGGKFSSCGFFIDHYNLNRENWLLKFVSQGRQTESYDIQNFYKAYKRACVITNIPSKLDEWIREHKEITSKIQ